MKDVIAIVIFGVLALPVYVVLLVLITLMIVADYIGERIEGNEPPKGYKTS